MKQFIHFSLYEFFNSCTRDELINAIKSKDIVRNIVNLDIVLEQLRSQFGKPICINSGFRNAQHNSRIGGSLTSQHLTGEAADIDCLHQEDFPLLAKIVINFGRLQNDLEDKELKTARIGQVILYTNGRNDIRFIHIALSNAKHPKFELWHDVRGTKFSDGLRKVVGNTAIENFIKLLEK